MPSDLYGGYYSKSGKRLYNAAAVRGDLALMAAGMAVPVRIWEYAAASMNLQTKEETFSAMVVYDQVEVLS